MVLTHPILRTASVALLVTGCAAQPRVAPSVAATSLTAGTAPQSAPPAQSDDTRNSPPYVVEGAPPPPATKVEQIDDGTSPDRTFGWVLVGVGAASAIAFVGTSIAMLHDKSVRDSNCDANKICNQTGLDANHDITKLDGWNFGTLAVAALGVGAGVALLLTSRSGHDDPNAKQTSLSVGPNAGGASMLLRSTF